MQTRQTHLDALKIVASQLIVLHHFAAYGPLADAMSEAIPRITAWLYDDARMAVQVFLVLGGYLAARSLAPQGLMRGDAVWRVVLQRYQRLVLPFIVAMLLAVISSMAARRGLDADFIPASPTWGQLLAHALLLQGVLGVEALSAGVWYVAIDFQLFALMAGLLWWGRSSPRLAQAAVMGLMLASLFFFNRDDAWDNWAPYFFGAYGLGAAAFWAGRSNRPGGLLALLALVGLLALMLDFRERIALALATALLLGLMQWWQHTAPIQMPIQVPMPMWLSTVIARLGQSSYALFLVHFSVLMLGNVLFVRLTAGGAWAAWLVLLLSWAASMALALGFQRLIEEPLSRSRPTPPA